MYERLCTTPAFVHFVFKEVPSCVLSWAQKKAVHSPKAFFPQLDRISSILAGIGPDKAQPVEGYVKHRLEKATRGIVLCAENMVVK